jgi:aspartate/methionine/tyrosine aminotransferase
MRIPPFGVERWFVRYEFNVELNIGESCIQPFTVRELCELCGEDPAELANLRVGYADGLGSHDLREAIANLYPETTPANVLVTTGAIEANYLVAQALLEPGDRAVVEFPAYQQLYSVPRSTGAEVRLWELREENVYRPDLRELERLAPAGQPLRMLTINHPHNPTGARISPETTRQLVEFAAARGATLHSDEVYRGLTLAEGVPESVSARSLSPDAVAVGSMSKAYGLAGARIGWVAGPAALVQRCSEIRDYVSICPSAISERLALMALRNRGRVLERNRAIARRNAAIVAEFLARHQDVLTCPLPDEGVIAFARYHRPPGDERPLPSSRELCGRLAEERGVLLVPGDCFEREHHFRIGFGYETDVLQRGLAVLGGYLEEALRAE